MPSCRLVGFVSHGATAIYLTVAVLVGFAHRGVRTFAPQMCVIFDGDTMQSAISRSRSASIIKCGNKGTEFIKMLNTTVIP